VRWVEYPAFDLFLPAPENSSVAVLGLRVLEDDLTAMSPPVVSTGTRKPSTGESVTYGIKIRQMWENIEAANESLRDWGSRLLFVPRPWKAPTQAGEKQPREEKKGCRVQADHKRCGAGTAPLEAARAGNHRRGMNPNRVAITCRELCCGDGCRSCRMAWEEQRRKEEADRIAEAMPRFKPAFPGEKRVPRPTPAFPGKGEPTIGGHDPTEPTFVFSSGTTTVGWKSGGESLVRAPEPRVQRNVGILGQIVRNTIDIEAVLELDVTGEAAEVVDILLSLSAFESHLKPGYHPQTRISRFMRHHAPELTASGLIQETPRNFGTNYMPLFTVPKKDETLRLIQDDRHLNEWYDRPPKMNLPRIHEVIDMLMRNEFFAQADAKSWFYQIPLHPDTHKSLGEGGAPSFTG